MRRLPIEKGTNWGEPGPVPDDAIEVASDAAAREALERARRDRRPFPPLLLRDGDLCRTLGGGAGAAPAGVRFAVDVGEALLDGRHHLFVAHLIARTPLWRRAVVVMNAQWLGTWNLGPRAHPGDGLLDTYEVRLPLGQLLPVRSRLGHGTHLPHPGMRERRTAAVAWELERPRTVRLDGVSVGRARSLSVRTRPDAAVVVI